MKYRILLILEDSRYITGPTIVLTRLANYLEKEVKCCEIKVVTFGIEELKVYVSERLDRTSHHNVKALNMRESILIQASGFWTNKAKNIERLLKIEIEAFQPTVIHFGVHTWDFMTNKVRQFGVDNILVSIHSPFNRVYQLLTEVISITNSSTAKYICVSDFIKQTQNRIRSGKVVTIYNGLELGRRSDTSKNLLQEEDLILGFIGSIRPEKGLHVLVESLFELYKHIHGLEIKLLIQGVFTSNNYRTNVLGRLNYLKELHEESFNYEVIGFSEKIDEFYDQVDVVVVPSIFEDPLPTVVVEALSFEKLVIASEIGGIPEILNFNNKLLFKSNDIKSLAEKLADIVESRLDYEKQALKESAELSNKFSLPKMANEYLDLCDYILE